MTVRVFSPLIISVALGHTVVADLGCSSASLVVYFCLVLLLSQSAIIPSMLASM